MLYWPMWNVIVRLCAFSCTVFVWDNLLKFRALFRRYELCVRDFILFSALMRFLDKISCFLVAELSTWWCDLKTVERWITKYAYEIYACLPLWDVLMRFHTFGFRLFVLMVGCKEVEEVDVEGRWFIGRCVVLCVQVGWFVGGGWMQVVWRNTRQDKISQDKIR
jgi:hypothetical protein